MTSVNLPTFSPFRQYPPLHNPSPTSRAAFWTTTPTVHLQCLTLHLSSHLNQPAWTASHLQPLVLLVQVLLPCQLKKREHLLAALQERHPGPHQLLQLSLQQPESYHQPTNRWLQELIKFWSPKFQGNWYLAITIVNYMCILHATVIGFLPLPSICVFILIPG